MRFLELRLERYGHFQDRVLDLSATARGLHVVHGANEAGKSTALRAILALLYGFPKQTPDDFRFAYKDLRVGARIETDDGRAIDITRLKRDKNSLVDAGGAPIDEGSLRALLGGVNRDEFVRMFGLDHDGLRRGGEELLKAGGALAESLFAAGRGGADVRGLRDALIAESEALFGASARTRKINDLVARADVIKKEADEALLNPSDYETRSRRLEDANAKARRLKGTLDERTIDVDRLQRRIQIRPKFDELDATERELAALALVPDLPESFDMELTQARTKRNNFTDVVRNTENTLDMTRAEKDAIRVARDVLACASAIRALHQEVGSYQAAARDLPGVKSDRLIRGTDADAILRDLDPALSRDAADATLRLPVARRAELNELVLSHQTITTRYAEAVERARHAESMLSLQKAERAAMPAARDPRSLAELCDDLARTGDPQKTANEAEIAAARARADLGRETAALPLWTRGADEIEQTPIPARATVTRFEREIVAIEQAQRELDERSRRLDSAAQERDERGRELARESEVPTEAALIAARQHRDQGWKLVRDAWLGGANDTNTWAAYDSGRDPAAAFEHAMREADEAADRLRGDSTRVAEAVRLELEAARDEMARAECVEAQNDWRVRRDTFEHDWNAEWRDAAVTPKSPSEMREWLDAFSAVREKARVARESVERAQTTRREADEWRARLSRALEACGEQTAAGETLAALHAAAKRIIGDERRLDQKRAIADAARQSRELELAEASGRFEQVRNERTRWADLWRLAVADLPMTGDAAPAQAAEVLKKLDEYFGYEKEIRGLDARIAKMTAHIEDVRRRARELSEVSGIAPAQTDAADLIEELHGRLQRAMTDNERLRDLEMREVQDEKALHAAKTGLQAALAEIDALRMRAKCDTADEIEDIARFAARKRVLAEKCDGLRSDLTREARGADLETLRGEITQGDEPSELDLDIAQRELDDLRREYDELRDEIAAARADLRDEAPASRAAQLLDERERVLAELRDAVARWRRLRFATHLLAARIESLGDRSQNPVLARAGELFQKLTHGSFEKLGANYSDDPPTIAGFRPTSRDPVPVPAMSDGARDQLWLALRLAWIERRAVDGLALPVIADDLLVQFDENRATAALESLAQLSDHTQVLLFTHHRHTSDLVRALNEETRSRVFEHELGG
ncbi:MAG: AAA family ATPase [Deltaproteobacteria bacterium]|nr:AAA family ATPase [Deltaproteobacteria bacterium]